MDFDAIKAGITSQATKMAELEAKAKKLEKVETELLAKVEMLESQESFVGKITALSKGVEDLRKDTEPMEKLRQENTRLLESLNNAEEGSAKKRKSPGSECVLPQNLMENATWWVPTAAKKRKAGLAALTQQYSTTSIWHHENKRLSQLLSEFRPTPGTNTVLLRDALIKIFVPGASILSYKNWKEEEYELEDEFIHCLSHIVTCGCDEAGIAKTGKRCEECKLEGKACVHAYRKGGITYVSLVEEDSPDDSDDSDDLNEE